MSPWRVRHQKESALDTINLDDRLGGENQIFMSEKKRLLPENAGWLGVGLDWLYPADMDSHTCMSEHNGVLVFDLAVCRCEVTCMLQILQGVEGEGSIPGFSFLSCIYTHWLNWEGKVLHDALL